MVVTSDHKEKILDKQSGLPTLQAILHSKFWFYYIWAVMIGAGGLQLIGNATPIALSFGATLSTAAVIVGMLSVTYGGGRFFIGIIYDRFGLRSTIIVNTISYIFSGLVLVIAF